MVGTLIIFGILFAVVLIHEAGHLVIAKKYGVGVPVYSIGFGPRIIGFKFYKGKVSYRLFNRAPHNILVWTKAETEYRIAPIPLGGYCRMEGEIVDTGKDSSKNLTSKTYFQKVMVAMGGAVANIITGFLAIWTVVASKMGFIAGLKATVTGILEAVKYTGIYFWDLIRGSEPLARWSAIVEGASSSASMEEIILQFGILSIIMALFNLIPFPALDGSLPFLWGLEYVLGKEKGQKIANILSIIGFTLLMGLQLFMVGYWIVTALWA